ncbi:MAG: hypothetical protein V4594_17595 [Bacteroidota bacterium]
MSATDNIRQIQVFNGEFWKASILQQLLSEHGIFVTMGNELMSSIDSPVLGPSGFKEVSLKVSDVNEAQALELIDAFENSEPLDEE